MILKKNDYLFLAKLFIRASALYFLCWHGILFLMFSLSVNFGKPPLSIFILAILLGLILTLGLWSASTNFGQKHKYFTIILMLPSLYYLLTAFFDKIIISRIIEIFIYSLVIIFLFQDKLIQRR